LNKHLASREEYVTVALWGTIVNALAIVIGSLIGTILPKIPERIHNTVMQGLGISIIVLGTTMAFKSTNFLIVIVSVVVGGVIGELLKIEGLLEQLGKWLEKRLNHLMKNKGGSLNLEELNLPNTLTVCSR
jgi:uncharacterized membrane protein YqgA involved in biofilm formation